MLPFQLNEDKNKKLTYEYGIENIMKNYEIHFPTFSCHLKHKNRHKIDRLYRLWVRHTFIYFEKKYLSNNRFYCYNY